MITIEYKFICNCLVIPDKESAMFTKHVKNISEFKKWFKSNHWRSTITEANQVLNSNFKKPIAELKNFNTFAK